MKVYFATSNEGKVRNAQAALGRFGITVEQIKMTYAFGPGKSKTFTFIEKGEIAKNLRPLKRTTMSDYWRIYIPKMLPSNHLALCEMTDDALIEWQEYFSRHSQFMMLGRWLSWRKR